MWTDLGLVVQKEETRGQRSVLVAMMIVINDDDDQRDSLTFKLTISGQGHWQVLLCNLGD